RRPPSSPPFPYTTLFRSKLVGLLPGSAVRDRYKARTVAQCMTPRAELLTVNKRQLKPDPIKAADAFFTENIGIHKMLVVDDADQDRKSTRLNSSHVKISY